MLPKRIFSSSKAILMITSVNKNTGRFVFIGAVVADRGTFCYYKSGQRLLQVGAAITNRSGFITYQGYCYKLVHNNFNLHF